MRDILEVENSSVIIILAWEDDFIQVCRVGVGNGVLVRIPASETHVEASHKGGATIDQA